MINLFDPDVTSLKVPRANLCYSCGKPWDKCRPSPGAVARFQGMTSLVWNNPRGMGLPLRKDYASLGLETLRVPEWVSLCCCCLVGYMTEFSRRLEARRQREGLPPLSAAPPLA